MYKYFWKFLIMEINLRRRKKINLYIIVCYGLIFKNLYEYGMYNVVWMYMYMYLQKYVDDFDSYYIYRFLDNIIYGWLWSLKDN